MNPLIVLTLLIGSALSEVVTSNTANQNTQFAEARDSNNWSSDAAYSSSSFTQTYTKPPTYSSNSFAAGDAAWGAYDQGFVASAPSTSILGVDLLSAGLNIVLGLFAFSLIMQIVSKLMATPLLDNFFDARAMNSDDMVMYANMAMNAYKKYEEMNSKIPK